MIFLASHGLYFLKIKPIYLTNLLSGNNIYNTFNITVKSIKSDNGKEFSNTNFLTLCQENEIIHNFTVPYNPFKNGKVERLNGILIFSAKALLNEAKFSRYF